MARLYIVETHDGKWFVWRSTPFREGTGRAPKVHNGMVKLGSAMYAVDPHRFRHIPIRRLRSGWLARSYIDVQLWRENEPEPVDFFDAKVRTDDLAGDIMADLSRSTRLKRLVASQVDMTSILLVLSILGNIILAVMIYFVATGTGPNGGAP